jgi:HD domain
MRYRIKIKRHAIEDLREPMVMKAIAGIEMPDSRLCRATVDYVRRVSAPFLFNHVMRSYAFAEAVGRAGGRRYDPELLFVATVLHDLGLTGEVPVKERFEVEGADAAKRFLSEQGVSDANVDIVWDAIALHTTVGIPQRKRPEIALCQLGTAIDVGFAPRALVTARVVDEVLDAYPRLGLKRALVAALAGLHEKNPKAAAASPTVAETCERHVHGFRRPHFCDVVNAADFPD